jgi:HSP20 family protein
MSLIRWRDPVDVMPSFQSLVDTFFGRDFPGSSFENYGSVPAVNVKETENNFALEVAVPGMSKENFDVHVDNNVMTISGKKEEKKEDKNDKWNRREFSYTSFERSFQLPDVADAEKIEAHYQDGILNITVPKKEMTKVKASKTISIK